MKTYTLIISGHEAETGLLQADVVRAIYTHDRASFWLEPSMVGIEDEYGEKIGEQQETFLGKLAWDVWFKDPRGHKEKGIHQAYGSTEDEAENAYLLECWKDKRWDDRFFVETDEEAFAEGAE